MWLFRVIIAVSLFGLLPITAPAATQTNWQETPLDRAGPEAPKAFPDLLRAWEQRFPPANENSPPDRIGFFLQLAVIVLGSLCLAMTLPRYRQRGVDQASRAASEISRMRWTIARSPFERWDDR